MSDSTTDDPLPPTSTETSISTSSSSSSSSSEPPPTPPPSSTPPDPTSSSSTEPPSSTDDDDESSSTSEPPSTTSSSSTSTEPTLTPSTTTSSTIVAPSVVTSFSTVTNSRSVPLPSSTSDESQGGRGFFQNTGAVAGVFSVVGIIVLALLIAFITNGIRRRKARKFDREIAEAAREAAAAQPPVGFLDDDDDGPRGYSGGGGGAYGGGGSGYSGGSGPGYGGGYAGGPYSDVSSHGTYQQPPLSSNSGPESYGMREIGSINSHPAPSAAHSSSGAHGPAPGEVFDYAAITSASAAAGAAGIGVARARSTRDGGNYGAALNDGSTPYAAFAAAPRRGVGSPPLPANIPTGYEDGRSLEGVKGYEGNRGLDILDAAGMGAHASGAGAGVGAGLNRGPSRSHYIPHSSLERNKSLNSHEGSQYYASSAAAPDYFPPMAHQAQAQQGQVGYDWNSQYGGSPPPQQYSPQGHSPQGQAYGGSASGGQGQQTPYNDDDDADAYGGYVVDDPKDDQQQAKSPGLPNPFDNPSGGGGAPQQTPMERMDSDADEEPRRVLKVANQ